MSSSSYSTCLMFIFSSSYITWIAYNQDGNYISMIDPIFYFISLCVKS
jgi:hypothetical protein